MLRQVSTCSNTLLVRDGCLRLYKVVQDGCLRHLEDLANRMVGGRTVIAVVGSPGFGFDKLDLLSSGTTGAVIGCPRFGFDKSSRNYLDEHCLQHLSNAMPPQSTNGAQVAACCADQALAKRSHVPAVRINIGLV